MTPIRRWRIHIGAHKTATTHLQNTLAHGREVLRGEGIDYIPRRQLRDAWLYTRFLDAARYRGWPARLRPHATQRRIEAMLQPMRQELDTLVLSEENLLGTVGGALGGRLYPKAERVSRLIRCLGPGSEITICIALRSPETLLPSAYVQYLRHEAPPPGGFAALRDRVIGQPPRWSELLFRLRRAAGRHVGFRIWRYEDYRDRRCEILAALCGGLSAALPDVPVPHSTRRVSADAVAEAEALPCSMPRDVRRRVVAAIFAESPADAAPFAPFRPEERARLADAYAQDLRAIGAAFGSDCLDFAPGRADAATLAGRMPFWLPVSGRGGISLL